MAFIRLLTILLALAPIGLRAQFEFVEDLTPSGGELEDFGIGVEVFGNEMFASWPHGFGNPDPAPACGELYHYEKNADGRWELLGILQAPDCSPGDMFGATSVALEGDLLAVPAFTGLRFDGQGDAGDSAVHLFERDPGYNPGGINAGWRPIARLTESEDGADRALGGLVEFNDGVLAVQSHVFENAYGYNFARSDSIVLFGEVGGSWQEIGRVSENTDFFGLGYSLSDEQLIVGAPETQTYGGAGRVYVYDRQGGQLTLAQTLDAGPEANFGYFVDVQDDWMAVGALNIGAQGAVFLYRREGGSWQPAGKLTPPDRAANDLYGVVTRFSGDLLFVGAENGRRQSEPAAGAVFIYQREGGEYRLIQTLQAPVDSDKSDLFGTYVSSNGTDLLVKAVATPAGGRAALYHFQREGGSTPPPTGTPFEVSTGHSGLFFNPERSGEGFMIDTLPDGRALMFWFTYDNGEPMWLTALGETVDASIVLDQVYVTEGGRFGPAFDPAEVAVTSWGSIVIDFEDCDRGTVSYDSELGQGSGQFELVRLSNIAGLDCGETVGTVLNGFSGGFYNRQRSGEGLQVHVTDIDGARTPVVYWPTYDADGRQVWLLGIGSIEGERIAIDNLRRLSGASFGPDFDPESVVDEYWGELQIDYQGCDLLTLSYSAEDPAYGNGQIQMERLYHIGQTTCSEQPSRY
ncbi:MAG: hypothetical protein V2J19_13365 [Wenzhouxiangella sp.]|jgi:hypothetical protein|nr:hypothetical protein [Wenzhouxiangella sp.]